MARERFAAAAAELAEIGRRFYVRGWALGTSGNLSAVVSRRPLRLAITPSAARKGELRAVDILQCDECGTVVGSQNGGPGPARRRGSLKRPRAGRGRPSAETLLHIEIARSRGAGAVLHTHSVWNTVLSDQHAAEGGLALEGYEMLKGLQGVGSHEHREWIPIIENDQDMPRLARAVHEMLARSTDTHAFLLRRHGLYTWGETLADAERHVEILEFLFETVGRSAQISSVN
jgi:methylthioribulose-1-phosphate dehydratase